MESQTPIPHPADSKTFKLKERNQECTKDHVLIALDGSPSSTYALEWAKEHFLNPSKHIVYLLTVARTNPKASMIYSAGIELGGGIPWSVIEEENKEALEEAKKIVRFYHNMLRETFKHEMEIHGLVGQGDARDEIVDVVEKIDAKVLILGNRGVGALKRTFLGSTGDYCLHHANCVVIIPKKKSDEPVHNQSR